VEQTKSVLFRQNAIGGCVAPFVACVAFFDSIDAIVHEYLLPPHAPNYGLIHFCDLFRVLNAKANKPGQVENT